MNIRILKELKYFNGGSLDVTLFKGHIFPVKKEQKSHYVIHAGGKDRFLEKTDAEVVIEKSTIDGVSPDQPIIYNENGGGQSDSPYRMDLVDPKSVLEIAKVLKTGADKYGADNWKKISIDDHLNHLLVHVYAHLAGDESDKHLAHAACRAIFALGVELEGE